MWARVAAKVAYLFGVVQALVVIVERGHAPLGGELVLRVGAHNVAGQKLLPEGEAARRAWSGWLEPFSDWG